jgi:tetratricopeptide (TPR) repeat protein
MRKLLVIGLIFLAAGWFSGCATGPKTVGDLPDDLPVDRYFRLAQEASSQKNYKLSLLYYEKIYELFPTVVNKITIAEYEEGFVYFKQKEYEKAAPLFQNVVDRFANPVFSSYFSETDRWALTLAQDRLNDIENIKAEIARKAAEKEAKKAEKAARKAERRAEKEQSRTEAPSAEAKESSSETADTLSEAEF